MELGTRDIPLDKIWPSMAQVWNMQFLDGGHWDSDPQKCVFGEVYKKVMSSLEELGANRIRGWCSRTSLHEIRVVSRKALPCNDFWSTYYCE